MRKAMLIAAVIAFGFNSPALASARVGMRSEPIAPAAPVTPIADRNRGYDGHPLARVVTSQDVRIEITKDRIFRSCCAPSDLVVTGKVTNITQRAINYIRIVIMMRDAGGHVVYSEDTYNHGAVTLFEDPEIAKLLNEKRHFDPLPPGASDTFMFAIPIPVMPNYQSVAVMAADVVRSPAMANSQ
jgi:hypothetical protein